MPDRSSVTASKPGCFSRSIWVRRVEKCFDLPTLSRSMWANSHHCCAEDVHFILIGQSEYQRSAVSLRPKGKTMKRFLVTVAATLCIVVASSAKADQDGVGEAALKCFHPGDRHMDTSCERLASDEAFEAAKRMQWSVLHVLRVQHKLSGTAHEQCLSHADREIRNRVWLRERSRRKPANDELDEGAEDVQDTWTPEPCRLENWTVVATSRKAAPSTGACQGNCLARANRCNSRCNGEFDCEIDCVSKMKSYLDGC